MRKERIFMKRGQQRGVSPPRRWRTLGFLGWAVWLTGLGVCGALGCGGGGGGAGAVCGNGKLEAGEECDVDQGLGTTCSAACTWQEFSVEPEPSGSATRPAVSVAPDGHFVVAYGKRLPDSFETQAYAVLYAPNGELLWGPSPLASAHSGNEGGCHGGGPIWGSLHRGVAQRRGDGA